VPRRPAEVTQADIAQAIRAAKEAGANAVIVDGDGVIRVALTASEAPIKPAMMLLTKNGRHPRRGNVL
jgi:hypothetical protein